MAYRTTSVSALQVITGTPPIDVLVEERGRIHDRMDSQTSTARKEEREVTLQLWQRRWRRRKELRGGPRHSSPTLRPGMYADIGRLSYYLSEFLTGHGSFRSYTKRLAKTDDEDCVYCGDLDTAEHTVLRCPRWVYFRRKAGWWYPDIGAWRLLEEMVKDRERWGEVEEIICQIMKVKEDEERRLQQEDR